MNFFNKYLSYFGFLDIYPECIDPSSEIMLDKSDQIISDVFFNNTSKFKIVFASLFFRNKIEKTCLELSVSLKKITSIDLLLINSVRILYAFIDFILFITTGLFIKRYFNVKVIRKLQKNNVVVFQQKKRNYDLNSKLTSHGLLYIDYSYNKTNDSKYTLRLRFKEFIKIIKLKFENFEIKTNDLIKYINLKNGFNLFYKDLEMEKNYKFYSQEGFAFSHRLFIDFFRSNNFKTYIFFNNINYSIKIPQLSDHIILRSQKSKKWIHKTDISKIIVIDLELNKFQKFKSSKIIKIAYLPDTHSSKNSLLKQKFLLNFIIELIKKTKKDVELIIRDHPQVYKKNKKYLKSIYPHFYSKHFKLSYDDHSKDFAGFINDIQYLFTAYYSTAIEDSILIGKPCFILENSGHISINNNIINNDLLSIIKIDNIFNIDIFLSTICETSLKKYHKLLIEDLFGNINKIGIEEAFNE